ncbi:MAG: hypothetical protein Q8873_00265 [Bacillota bacterium]|nr:hypothetical protein [Bacillota bacterium]
MQRKDETTPFEKKSHFNNSRDSYVDESGNYIYTQWVRQENGKWEREVLATIPFTEENRDIIILLDQDDHDVDLGSRYDDENTDFGFRNQQKKSDSNSTEDDDFRDDPINCIAGKSADTFSLLFQEESPTDPRIAEITEWIHSLPESQIDLIYEHLGAMKFLEDIRREEELCTGKAITKQAMHNRWNKIIAKACKYFGVDKPKQNHCK